MLTAACSIVASMIPSTANMILITLGCDDNLAIIQSDARNANFLLKESSQTSLKLQLVERLFTSKDDQTPTLDKFQFYSYNPSVHPKSKLIMRLRNLNEALKQSH